MSRQVPQTMGIFFKNKELLTSEQRLESMELLRASQKPKCPQFSSLKGHEHHSLLDLEENNGHAVWTTRSYGDMKYRCVSWRILHRILSNSRHFYFIRKRYAIMIIKRSAMSRYPRCLVYKPPETRPSRWNAVSEIHRSHQQNQLPKVEVKFALEQGMKV
jgi:hypothetical protein